MTIPLITAGIDIGSTTAQAAVIEKMQLLAYHSMPVGVDKAATADRVLNKTLEKSGIDRSSLSYIVGTGFGRYRIPFADKNITEISCHARGATFFYPAGRTVLDIGGQDCKAIRCDVNGKVKAFAMNEKCAAGTGRSLEVIARLLDIPVNDIGPRSLEITQPPPLLSSGCVVFARSEALKLIRSGVSLNAVLAAYCESLVNRLLALLQRVGIEEELVISGGVAHNIGVVKRLEDKLGIKARICFEPQIVGAVGAAILAGNWAAENPPPITINKTEEGE